MYSKAVGGHDKVGAPAKLHSPIGNAILLEHVCNPNIDMTCDDHIQCKCKHCKGTSKHYVYVFIYTYYRSCSILQYTFDLSDNMGPQNLIVDHLFNLPFLDMHHFQTGPNPAITGYLPIFDGYCNPTHIGAQWLFACNVATLICWKSHKAHCHLLALLDKRLWIKTGQG